jgi:hypothetical protein
MKKFVVSMLGVSMAFSSCSGSESTKSLFVESLQKGAEANQYDLSDESATCIADKAIPLMKEDVLKEKLSGEEFNLLDSALYKDEKSQDQYKAARIKCMTDDEYESSLAATIDKTGSSVEQVLCTIENVGGKDAYADLIASGESKAALIKAAKPCDGVE